MTKVEAITYAEVKAGDLLRMYDNEVSGPYEDRRVTSCHCGKGSTVFIAFAGRLWLAQKTGWFRCYRVVNCPCEACGSGLAEWGCTRLVERYLACPIRDLKNGDRVCRWNEDGPKRGAFATVYDWQRLANGNVKYSIYINRRTPGTIRSKTLEFGAYCNVKRATMVPCGALLCEECAQNPGDPHRYCPEHWTIHTLAVA